MKNNFRITNLCLTFAMFNFSQLLIVDIFNFYIPSRKTNQMKSNLKNNGLGLLCGRKVIQEKKIFPHFPTQQNKSSCLRQVNLILCNLIC